MEPHHAVQLVSQPNTFSYSTAPLCADVRPSGVNMFLLQDEYVSGQIGWCRDKLNETFGRLVKGGESNFFPHHYV